MTRSISRSSLAAIVALVALISSSCTVKSQDPPPLTGPSEQGTSIVVSVSPDLLTQDGGSQSQVTVTARDANGRPKSSVSMRSEIVIDGVAADFGSLSARNIVTGSDGTAKLWYTAPPAPAAPVDNFTIVTIVVTPVGTDFGNSLPRLATIRLVPPGGVIPPDGLQPKFVFSPSAPQDHQTVFFDASTSTSTSTNPIGSYAWDFGDGGTAAGKTATHAFNSAGSYVVKLTISDSFNRTASTSQIVTVSQGDGPTAEFTTSPDVPQVLQQVNFNGSASKAAAGRTIRSYSWDFGDGDQKQTTGPTTTHDFVRTGTFTVTLVVTDDAGRTGSQVHTVTVVSDTPVADFTVSPASPRAGQVVAFNATATPTPGRTITSYTWDFGGPSASPPSQGPSTSSSAQTTYAAVGGFTVTLTVVDSAGKTGRVTKTVTVQ